MSVKPNCPKLANRYLCVIFVAPTAWYSVANLSGCAQNTWAELNDAQCAIERAVQANATLAASGFMAYVIDTHDNKIVAFAASPKKPTLDWQEPSSPVGSST